MGEVFEFNSKSAQDNCSHALLASAQGKPLLKPVQAEGGDDNGEGKPMPGGAQLMDLVWRYTPTKLQIEQEDWGPKHKAWEDKIAELIKKDPTKFDQLDAHGFISNVADAAFDLGTKKLFDIFLEDVNKDLKGKYSLSLRPDQNMLAYGNAASLFQQQSEGPDFAGYLDLKDKSGKVLGSIPIRHTPIPGTRLLV